MIVTLEMRLFAAAISAALIGVTWAWAPPLAVVATLPILWALRGASARQGAIAGFVMGFGSSAVLAGLAHAGLALYLGVALSYGVAGAIFGGLHAAVVHRPSSWARPWLSASIWVLVEWCHMQVPYAAPNVLGDSQHMIPFLHLAYLGGTLLISFVLVGISAAFLEMARPRELTPRGVNTGFGYLSMNLVWIVGVMPGLLMVEGPPEELRLLKQQEWMRDTLELSVQVLPREVLEDIERSLPWETLRVNAVQGGLPTWLYARAEQGVADPWHDVPQRVYFNLTHTAPPADLTVWPETAVWQVWGESPEYEQELRALAGKRRESLLVGVPRRDSASSFANSAVLITPGHPDVIVDKRRLALRAEAGFSPGTSPALVTLPEKGRVLGVVFCLETVVPDYIRDVVQGGAEAVIVLAEGGRFGKTPVGKVHANHSVVRAMESGRAILHAGQHGFTHLVYPDGSIEDMLNAYHTGVLNTRLPLSQKMTPYMTWGDWPAGLSAIITVLGALVWRRRS